MQLDVVVLVRELDALLVQLDVVLRAVVLNFALVRKLDGLLVRLDVGLVGLDRPGIIP